MLHPLAIQMPGFGEWLIIAAIGLLFFGKRLPEVGRGLGRSIVEFKKGLKGIEDEIDQAVDAPSPRAVSGEAANQQLPPPGYKFDPYTGKPVEQPASRQ